MTRLLEGESIPVISNIFHFTLVYNTGIAFGLFSEHRSLLIILISLSIFGLIVLFPALAGKKTPARIAFALILGGAVGNWIDRIRFEAVIDFLDFRVWPVFNLADSAITIGVVFYLWIILREQPDKQKSLSEKETTV